MTRAPKRLPRLVDLYLPWHLQYVAESSQFDPNLYPEIPSRIPRLAGVLQTTKAAILVTRRSPEDWSRQSDRWASLSDLLARSEAEFPGRLVHGPDDWQRLQADPDSLAWGVLAVVGFDSLIRDARDLDHLPALFDRGVRVFGLVEGPGLPLGGSERGPVDRGLTDLGRQFLETLANLAPTAPSGPRPAIDLAGLNACTASDVLEQLAQDPNRRLLPILSHGAIERPGQSAGPGVFSAANVSRLRELGGFIGLTPLVHSSPDDLAETVATLATVPIDRRSGVHGIALGTNWLGVHAPPGHWAADVATVRSAMFARLGHVEATALIHENGLELLRRLTGLPNVEATTDSTTLTCG